MIKKIVPYLFLVISCMGLTNAEAYVHNRTQTDALVHWSNSIDQIAIFVNPTNTQSYPTSLVEDQVASAATQWSGKSRMTIQKNTTAGTNQIGLNEVYFSNDASVFGDFVIGVTQVSYKNNTGEILEADILLNDSFPFSTNDKSKNYLGNVITHEMGHFLGLGHSQVNGSTMFYALSRGQNQITDDDKAGVYSIYPNGDSTKGIISGKIIGGKKLVGVFAAHVQAISLKTGKVAGAAISDNDGSFIINGLERGDQYYIYTSPTVQGAGLPTKYNNARYDFCTSSKKYRGSFFQTCSTASEGYPQAVKLASSQVSIGNITIRCGLDAPATYMQNKNQANSVFDIQSNVVSGIGNAFTGYFSPLEITNGSKDYFRMNYSGVNWDALEPSNVPLFVELKVLNQSFYSPFKAQVEVTRSMSGPMASTGYVQEDDGWLNIENIIRIPINRLDLSGIDNDFDVTVTPLAINTLSSVPPLYQEDYFPESSKFEDPLKFYLVSASIVKDNGNGTYSLVSSKNTQLTDNSSCSDAVNTYALSDFAVKGASTNSSKKKDDGIACGTVDMSGSSGNGPGGFFIGLIVSLLLCSLTSSIIRNNGKTWVAR